MRAAVGHPYTEAARRAPSIVGYFLPHTPPFLRQEGLTHTANATQEEALGLLACTNCIIGISLGVMQEANSTHQNA